MTRLAPALVRRIDRLARGAHAFHRFAHHPLCSNYREELVLLGRRRWICRGCAFAALGASAGVLLGATLPVDWVACASAAALAIGLSTLSLRVRLPKFVGRFLPAALGAFAALTALRADSAIRWCGLVAVPIALLLAREVYRRRGPNRAACVSCPERELLARCSGYAPIVRRERAFQRVAQRWIDAAHRDAPSVFAQPK
jgi:hypothetical protein